LEGADLLQRDPHHKDPIIDPANLDVHDPALPAPDAKYIKNFRKNINSKNAAVATGGGST
jgi:hypothetical protein